MWYGIVRVSIGLILGICLFFILKKTQFTKRRILAISLSVCIIFLTSLLFLLPLENLFVHFSTPQSVFRYSIIGKIDEVMAGKSSAMILYQNNDAISISILPKSEKGWKISTYFSYEKISSQTVSKRIIDVYRAKGTEDYYVLIQDPFASATVEVADNVGSTFQNLKEDNQGTNTQNITYYAYVYRMDSSYTLSINQESILIA